MPERHGKPVFAENAALVQQLMVGDRKRRGPCLDVPVEQDQKADAEGKDQQHEQDEPEGMRPEHRRMRLIDHLSRHSPPPHPDRPGP
jgi:hypothetical protein